MIVNQGLLGVDDGLLDRLQLLGDLKATAALVQHGDNALKVAVGTLETFNDGWVGSMSFHGPYILTSRGGYCQCILAVLKF